MEFEDIEDPSFNVKTFGKRAKLQGQYIAVPMEAPLLLTALIQSARQCETLDRAKPLLDKAGEVLEVILATNTVQTMAVVEHHGKKVRIPD